MQQEPTRSFGPDGDPSGRPPPAIPDHVLLFEIGHGSYGRVWLARNVMGQLRAVKVVDRGNFSDDEPYEREYEGIRRFEPLSREHAGLMDVLHVGRDESARCFYYIMELADDASLDGQSPSPGTPGAPSVARDVQFTRYTPKTLKSLLRAGPPLAAGSDPARFALPFADCVRIATELVSALAHLHRHGLVHRDIKPANIIFAGRTAKLADIGLVTQAAPGTSPLGTTTYLAPEGSGGKGADIYALGVVLYEMLTGLDSKCWPSLPPGFEDASEELKELNQIAMRACSGNPTERYQSAEEMLLALEALANKPLREAQQAVRRQRRIIAALAALLLVGSVGFRFAVLTQRASEERRRHILENLRFERMKLQADGWFNRCSVLLGNAAAIRMDPSIHEHASALLPGLDAQPIKVLPNVEASSAAFAPDGRALIDGTEQAPAHLVESNGDVTELAFRGSGPVGWTPDGIPLQLVAGTNCLELREARTGDVRREFRLDGVTPSAAHRGPVLAIALDSALMAAGWRGRLALWNADTGELLGEAHADVTALAFSPDGFLLGAGHRDGTTRIFAVTNLSAIATLPPPQRGNPILCLAFGRDPVVRDGMDHRTNSWLVATGDQGAVIVIWDLIKRLPRRVCQGSTYYVSALAMSPDGSTLASAGRNQPRLWDVASGRPLLQLSETSSGSSLALAFDATGQRLVTGGLAEPKNATAALWQLEPDRGIRVLRGLSSSVRQVWCSDNSERVAGISDDWQLAIWDLKLNRLLFTFETPIGGTADGATGCFGPGGGRFALGSGREVCLYDPTKGSVLARWPLPTGDFHHLQFDAQGQLLLLCSVAATGVGTDVWRLYQLDQGRAPLMLKEQSDTAWIPAGGAFSPSAKCFFAWSPVPQGILLRAYDTATGQEVWKTATDATIHTMRVRFDPTGNFFGFTSFSKGAVRLRLVTFPEFKEIETLSDGFESMAPFGKRFALDDHRGWSIHDSPVRLENGISLATDWSSLRWVSAFSPDGRLFTWGTIEGAVLVADLEQVQRRLTKFRRW